MALGNSNAQAQSRGKNKPVIVKRRKEVVAGKSLFTGTISPISETGHLKACTNPALTPSLHIFHDGAGPDRYLPGTKIYTRRRVNDAFTLADGFYAVDDGREGKGSIEIVNGALNGGAQRC